MIIKKCDAIFIQYSMGGWETSGGNIKYKKNKQILYNVEQGR